jgi:predicted membrane protein
MKKYITIISLGIINLLHASLHIIQAIQSFLLVNQAVNKPRHFGEKYLDEVSNFSNQDVFIQILHSPYFAILWAIIGIFTLYIGIKDFIHHRKCKH